MQDQKTSISIFVECLVAVVKNQFLLGKLGITYFFFDNKIFLMFPNFLKA